MASRNSAFSDPLTGNNNISKPPRSVGSIAVMALAAIGIVYGDIGTSPIYTMKAVFSAGYGLAPEPPNVLGVVSLIFWGLTIVVSLKYVALIMRADNRGEGGIMALMALALETAGRQSRWYRPLLLIGLFGAALFYGDGVITPAISVLSAIEGIEVATPAFKPYVVPLTVIIMVWLYMMQKKGTAGIGRWFAPVMLIWFIVIAGMGTINIAQNPAILAAVNPLHGLRFLADNRWLAFIALGAIVLAFTGAEALYADMGHFGKKPIRMSWFVVVFPALALNYLGQGALLLSTPEAAANPFYLLLGPWSVYPLVILSTLATVIASQSIISGTFSMTRQAISLGVLPRMRIVHTSNNEIGQVYIPLINWLQLVAVLLAVLGFGSSEKLAVAFGLSVAGTMMMTTILTYFVIRFRWGYSRLLCIGATGFFLAIDGTFLSANTLKFVEGGWFPLVIGAGLMLIMVTWDKGRRMLSERVQARAIPVDDFLQSLFVTPPSRVRGTAVFFRAPGEGVPHALLHNLSHNRIVHERVVFLTVFNADVPTVPAEEQTKIEPLAHGFYQVNLTYGFKDERDIPLALARCKEKGAVLDVMETSFFLSKQALIPAPGNGMARWRMAMFTLMHRNARDAADYYRIPASRMIRLGTQVNL